MCSLRSHVVGRSARLAEPWSPTPPCPHHVLPGGKDREGKGRGAALGRLWVRGVGVWYLCARALWASPSPIRRRCLPQSSHADGRRPSGKLDRGEGGGRGEDRPARGMEGKKKIGRLAD